MAPEEDLKKRVGRKLTKRRREGRQVTMDIPERFRDGDDADDDCSAPRGHNAYINQSVFGMIAGAAGSQVDFNARFDGQSSDDEEEAEDSPPSELKVNKQRSEKATSKQPAEKHHRRKFSESKLLRSLSGLSSRSKSKSSSKNSSSHDIPPEPPTPDIQVHRMPSHTPVMSRMLEAKAELSLRPSFDLSRLTDGTIQQDESGQPSSNSLAMKLKEIFQFEKPEEVIEEYPCWLLKSVLLQGYMYITTRHICFYAYFPKKSVSTHTRR